MKHIIGANLTSTVPQSQTLTVDEDSAGQRLDNFLMRHLKGVPKTHVYRIIRSGEVRINKGRVSADTRIAAGDLVRLPPVRVSERADEKAQAMAALVEKAGSSGQGGSAALSAGGFAPAKDFPILFEDDYFLAINKPAGTITAYSASRIDCDRASGDGAAFPDFLGSSVGHTGRIHGRSHHRRDQDCPGSDRNHACRGRPPGRPPSVR